jgi:hypothetical protein
MLPERLIEWFVFVVGCWAPMIFDEVRKVRDGITKIFVFLKERDEPEGADD